MPRTLCRRRDLQAEACHWLKTVVEPHRTALTCGPHLLGWFPADVAVDQVVAELVKGAEDPRYLAALPWPRWCVPWPWTPGEQIALWRAGRLLGLVALGQGGRTEVTRFDQ